MKAKFLSVWVAFWVFGGVGYAQNNENTLFEFNKKPYKYSDLKPSMQQAVYEAEKTHYEAMSAIFDNSVLEEYLDKKAKEQKKSLEDLEKELFAVKNIGEKEAKDWFDQNKERLGGRDFNSIKSEITQLLSRQQQEEMKTKLIATIKKESGYTLAIKEPTAPKLTINSDGYPSKGGKTPKVTIVEFADYLCPHCRKASENLKKVMEKYKDEVKLVYMDFPLSHASVSSTIAEGAVCADKQNKFWEYHYLAFNKQNSLNKESPATLAKELTLDVDSFKKCLDSPDVKTKVELARKEGERVGVQGTPAIYINGLKHQGGYSEEALIEDIKKML